MSVLLTKELKHENQAIELVVKYDVKTNTVKEVKSVWLITFGQQIPVGNLMMKFFEPAINKIIDETDWREIHRMVGERDDVECNVHPVMMQALKPFLKY